MSIGFVILFPITFLSNIFVGPDTMPAGLRAFADVNPVSHLVTAERDPMDGPRPQDRRSTSSPPPR